MSKKVLLIADDDEMNRMIIRKFLKDTYDIIEAADGQEALDIVRENPVDVLLLDIIMPRLDGLEMLQIVKKEDAFNDMGILVATSTKEKTERQALALGADDIVSKPYDPVVIHKRLENIIAVKENQKQKRLLQNSDVNAMFLTQKQALNSAIIEHTDRIQKLLDIINKNKTNDRLITEMMENIQREIEDIQRHLIEE